jgi:hypothetical protein
MSALLNYILLLIQSYGYDALMLLLVCCQTWLAAITLRPSKPARTYPLRLITTKRRNIDKQ